MDFALGSFYFWVLQRRGVRIFMIERLSFPFGEVGRKLRDRFVEFQNCRENFYIRFLCASLSRFSTLLDSVSLLFSFRFFALAILDLFLLTYLLSVSSPLFRKIHFSGVAIVNEVVDVEAALKPFEWTPRTRQSLSMT